MEPRQHAKRDNLEHDLRSGELFSKNNLFWFQHLLSTVKTLRSRPPSPEIMEAQEGVDYAKAVAESIKSNVDRHVQQIALTRR